MSWRLGVALMIGGMIALGQTNAVSRPRFAVASIHPDSPDNEFASELRTELAGGRLHVGQMLLRSFIEDAYGIRPFQISGGPRWINSQGYTIEATAEGSVSKQEMSLMMRTLLEDRFRLKVHRETRDLPVYNLRTLKGGHKLSPANDGGCVSLDPTAPLPQSESGQPPAVPCGRALQITTPAGARMRGKTVVMPELIRVLTTVLGRPVIDKTGFTRAFDFDLEFALDDVLAGLHPTLDYPLPATDPGKAASILTAIQQQLGLKLEAAKGPVEILVIDYVERPGGN
jgi:uncharacterized protein (TIGR03435 family)